MEEREIRPADLDLTDYGYARLIAFSLQDGRAVLVMAPITLEPIPFERLTFEDTTPFLASGEPGPLGRAAWDALQRTGELPRLPGVPEVKYLAIRSVGRPWSPAGPPWRLTLKIGHIPTIEFDFSSLRLARRWGLRSRSGGPIYDADTGEPFSFEDPFPG